MRTWSPNVSATSSDKPCAACPDPTKDLARVLVDASKYASQAHMGIAGLYDQCAMLAKTQEDRDAFSAKAVEHREMAQKTAQVIVPEE